MRVTIEQIESKIKGETYLVLPDGRTTLCILDLENGYTIKGLSACVDPAEFDLALGRQYAREDAVNQIWPLEGYLLAEKMYLNRETPKVTKVFELLPQQVQAIKDAGFWDDPIKRAKLIKRYHEESLKAPPKKLHWTQTPEGKKKMASRKKAKK